jgi:hypothetical protein
MLGDWIAWLSLVLAGLALGVGFVNRGREDEHVSHVEAASGP